MSVSKRYDKRQNQILDIAEALFASLGYERTTVNDILDGVGIGKGTFYYYFKSKQEVMNAVIDRIADSTRAESQSIADLPDLSAHEKMVMVFAALPHASPQFVEQLHHEDNSAMHLRSLVETVQALAPALAQIIEQGVSEGVYDTAYPRESFEILYSAGQFLLDTGLFRWTKEEFHQRVLVYIHILESVLGSARGSFGFLYEIFANSIYKESTTQ
jgi:AcrR family transcriptional regulator